MNAVAVKVSCVFDVKSGTAVIISSGRVLVFNCSLKARYSNNTFFIQRHFQLCPIALYDITKLQILFKRVFKNYIQLKLLKNM